MKLIRISSDDNSAFFETQFNQSINIKPMSKIGLNNFSANLKPTQLISQSNNIKFKILAELAGDLMEGEALITDNTYNRNNFWDMLDEITNDFNSTLEYKHTTVSPINSTENLLGSQWRCSVVDKQINTEFRIGYNNSEINNFQKSITINFPSSKTLAMANAYSSTTNYNNIITSKYNIAKGVGYLRVQLNKLIKDDTSTASLNSQGFFMGFSKITLPNYLPVNFEEADISYGVGIGWNSVSDKFEFYYQEGGRPIALNIEVPYIGVGAAGNPGIEIMTNAKAIQISYTDILNQRIIIKQFEYDVGGNLYPFIGFHSNENFCSVSNYCWTLDPFSIITTDHSAQQIPNSLFINPNQFTVKGLDFSSQLLIDFLNYDIKQVTTLESPGEKGAYNFIAPKLFFPSISERNFILELLSFNVESYDSSQKQRRNIISCVITSDENDVISNEPNIIFIDLLNEQEIDIRNLTLRLVDINYNPIEVLGTSVATVLIADEKEKSF